MHKWPRHSTAHVHIWVVCSANDTTKFHSNEIFICIAIWYPVNPDFQRFGYSDFHVSWLCSMLWCMMYVINKQVSFLAGRNGRINGFSTYRRWRRLCFRNAHNSHLTHSAQWKRSTHYDKHLPTVQDMNIEIICGWTTYLAAYIDGNIHCRRLLYMYMYVYQMLDTALSHTHTHAHIYTSHARQSYDNRGLHQSDSSRKQHKLLDANRIMYNVYSQ